MSHYGQQPTAIEDEGSATMREPAPGAARTGLNIIMIGPPGAGKGTQSRALAAQLKIPYVPTGDLFRSEIAAGTPVGLEASRYMDRGELVPDGTTIRMVLERLRQPDCRMGVVLDGFPRSVAQAEALDAAWAVVGQAVSVVLHMKARSDVVLTRMSNRWVCPKDGAVYNRITKQPRVDNICDLCSTALVQRPDETSETQRVRLEVYDRDTAPILRFYEQRGLVRTIDAERSMTEVSSALREAIEGLRRVP